MNDDAAKPDEAYSADGADSPKPSGRNEQEPPALPAFLENPGRVDIILIVLLFAIVIYNFAMIPLRGFLLSHPLTYNLLVGGYTSAVVSGANASVGNGAVWLYLLATVFGAAKFTPIYWLMGRRWGHDFIDMSVQYMPRMKKLLRNSLGTPSRKSVAFTSALVPLGYAPGPVPPNIVNAVLGLLRVPLLAVLALNALSVILINGVFMWLGYVYGEPVLDIVSLVNRYLLWITLGLVGIVILRAYMQAKKQL